MSLILEALKKSEQQRQREKAPSLQSIHQPVAAPARSSARSWWLFAVFIAIGNLAFWGYWFWRQPQAPAPTAQAVSRTLPEAIASQQPSVNSAQPADTARAGQSSEQQPEFTQISPRGTQAQPLPTETAQRVEEISELPENVRNSLPAMTFSFHVYSESPEQRTIIINDRRVREGDQISAGLILQSITSDGVILLFEQHRIHISVLSEW